MGRMTELENMYDGPLDDDYRPYNPPPFWDKREDDWQALRVNEKRLFTAIIGGLVVIWAAIGVAMWVWL